MKNGKRQQRGIGAVAALAALAIACGESGHDPAAALEPVDAATYAWPEGPNPTAVIAVAGYGEIEIELFPSLAPSTVKNFVRLSRNGFFTETTFHRVIPGFMIQGGDPNSRDDDPKNDGGGGPGWNIADEFTDAPHVRGVVSMANTGSRNSGGSQFFIVHGEARHLDGHHTVFGRVTRGLDVVDTIAAVPTDEHGRWGPAKRPLTNVVIESVAIQDPQPTTGVARSTPTQNADT